MSFASLSSRSYKNNNSSKKVRQEDLFIRRRDSERKHRELWNGVTDYFHYWDVKTNKFNAWVSPEYFDASNEAYQAKKKEKTKGESVAIRRKKLAELLEKERIEWEIELKERRSGFRFGKERSISNDLPGLEELQALNEGIRKRREEIRREQAKLRLHHCWALNNPVLREFESKQKEKFVRQAWEEQQEEKRLKEEEILRLEKEAKILRDKKLEEEQLKEDQKLAEAREAIKKNKEDLLAQHLENLRDKQRIANELKEEECRVLAEQREIEKLVRERRTVEERRKKETIRLSLTKQIQLRLRRTAQETREALEEDLQLLKAAIERERTIVESERQKKLETKQWMEEAYVAFKKQAEEARRQEEDAQTLFHEEAVRMWKRHEERWRKEQEARDKLMQEVLQTLEEQVKQNLERNLREQRELLELRGKLLEEAEEAQREVIRKKEADAQFRKSEQLALLNQIDEKRKMKEDVERQERDEAVAHEEDEKKEQERLLKEIQRIQLRYNPMKQPYPKRVW